MFMQVQMIARASGPFGELSRKSKLDTPKYPRDYLNHLVEIGVAVVTIADKPEPALEYKAEKKSISKVKTGSSSPAAQVSQKKTSTSQKGITSSQSIPTTK